LFFASYLAFFLLFAVAIVFPQTRTVFFVDKLLRYVGLIAPNVFNKADLKMSEKWFVIVDKQSKLIPYTGYEGERLSMHRSDVIYYANSLLWRRSA